MNASQESCTHLYDCSCKELDVLTHICRYRHPWHSLKYLNFKLENPVRTDRGWREQAGEDVRCRWWMRTTSMHFVRRSKTRITNRDFQTWQNKSWVKPCLLPKQGQVPAWSLLKSIDLVDLHTCLFWAGLSNVFHDETRKRLWSFAERRFQARCCIF